MIFLQCDVLIFGYIAGCMMSIALGRENIENQIKLAQTEAFNQLVRLLRTHKDSPQVILMVIQVLGILCVGKCFMLSQLIAVDTKFGQVDVYEHLVFLVLQYCI